MSHVKGNRKGWCMCISRKCGEVESVGSDGTIRRGNLIELHLLKAHTLQDQRKKLVARISLNNSPPNSHASVSSSSNLQPPAATNIGSPESSSGHHELPATFSETVNGTNDEFNIRYRPEVTTSTHLTENLQSTSTNLMGNAEPVLQPEQSPATDGAVHNTSCYMKNEFENANPVLYYPLIVTTALVVFDHISRSTASWLLSALQGFIQLIMCYAMGREGHRPGLLSYFDQLTLDEMPRDVRTLFSKFQLDPNLMLFNSCPSCFCLYHLDHTPLLCSHRLNQVPGLFDLIPPQKNSATVNELEPTCSQALFKGTGNTKTPIRQYAVQDLHSWISRFVSRQTIEDQLEATLVESCKSYDPEGLVGDIHQSYIWKHFLDVDGNQFTASSGNLVFGMYVDGINPFGTKSGGTAASITFVVLVCLSLPFKTRYLPENLFLVGISPGPHEPSLDQMNHILSPVVVQLIRLWREGIFLSQTKSHPQGRRIRAALLPFIADLPAIRRSLGFASHSASNFCSFCTLTLSEIDNLNPRTWSRRTTESHKELAFMCRDSDDPKERNKIFAKHGVRYSVLNELDYWRIIDYQVVDSMHNLLLGLLKHHCQTFWQMSDQEDNDPDADRPTVAETRDLLNDLAINQNVDSPPRPQPQTNRRRTQRPPTQSGEVRFEDMVFGTHTSSTDPDYENQGWSGEWTEPSFQDEIVFDRSTVNHINKLLPRIHIPTWINRPIPVLGKASFGKLKADEWRNLFTIQLPLILIPKWSNGDQYHLSLLENFKHLSCLVIVALKRSTSRDRIKRYRYHLKTYLQSCSILFPESKFVPNHHMAFHLAEGLEKFGPVRAWWSFPFERYMGTILKSCHNNRIGQMEITFMKSFYRGANFAALLKDDKVPTALKPFLEQLLSIIEPIPFVSKTTSSLPQYQPIDPLIYKQLIKYMNTALFNGCAWTTPADWSFLPSEDKEICAPVHANAKSLSRVTHRDVTFTTFSKNQDDSIIQFKTGQADTLSFGMITSLFEHRRVPPGVAAPIDDKWACVEPFLPVPPSQPDCFHRFKNSDLQADLRLTVRGPPHLVHITDIVSHCAWIQYKAKEITPQLKMPTIALISVNRE